MVGPDPSRRLWLLSAAAGLTALAVLLATAPFLAMVWDEGYVLGQEARLRDWFRGLRDPARFAREWRPLPVDEELLQADAQRPPRPSEIDTRSKLLFHRATVEWFWPFAREEPHGHPPFYALLGLLGDLLAPWWSALARARLAPMLLYGFTAGALFHFIAARWGAWAALAAWGSWLLQPNLFAQAHYAAYDAVLTSLWALAIMAFANAIGLSNSANGPDPTRGPRWGWAVLFGGLLGCAMATKLTGWFLVLPFAAWAVVRPSRRAFQTLLVGGAVGGVVLWLLVPAWWTAPLEGLVRFWGSNLSRAETVPISVEFLGRIYRTPRESLPWYNTLAWTLMVTPLGFLALGTGGLIVAARRWRSEPLGALIAGHWAFLMTLRALPHAPGHDGVRLFLPAFGMLALLSGPGASAALARWGRWGRALVVAALVEGALSVAIMMPVPLSYFSPLVGGLPGAAALGMEPTYYWDALGPEARRWLADHTPAGETIQFASFPTSWLYLRREGELPRRVFPIDPGPPRWFVVQNRPGPFTKVTRALIAHGRPAFTVKKLGVPLIWIFPRSELTRLGLAPPVRPRSLPRAHGPDQSGTPWLPDRSGRR